MNNRNRKEVKKVLENTKRSIILLNTDLDEVLAHLEKKGLCQHSKLNGEMIRAVTLKDNEKEFKI